jgi:multiple sugar transport system substrate-binding protein
MPGLTLNGMVFRHSRFPNAAKALLTFLMEDEQYDPWLQANIGYWSQPLNAYAASAVWSSDPKISVFRDQMNSNFWLGYKGPITGGSLRRRRRTTSWCRCAPRRRPAGDAAGRGGEASVARGATFRAR